MINNDYKRVKPQRIVQPASAENSISDMAGAYSDVNNRQLPTTFKPNYATAPITTFHPKGTIQTISNTKNSQTTLGISTYHPKTSKIQLLTVPDQKTTEKINSRYDVQTTTFLPTKVPSIRPNVKNLLATIGLEPDSSSETVPSPKITSTFLPTIPTTTTTTTTPKPELTPELKELLESFGLLTNEEPPAHLTAGPYQEEFLPVFPSALKDDSLSVSEFRPLPKSVTASDIKEKIDSSFEIKADDFSSFKRLPISDEEPAVRSDEEFESILKSYGLIDSDGIRDMKAIEPQQIQDRIDISTTPALEKVEKMMKVPEVDVQFLSPDLAKVLGDFGIKSVNEENEVKTSTKTTAKKQKIETTTTTYPSTSPASSSTMQNDLQKLHHLLDTIKQLDKLNANLTEEELDSLNPRNFNFSQSFSDLAIGPDPLETFYESDDSTKNEVKRQTNSSQPTKISLDITGSTTSTTASPSSTTASDSSDDVENDSVTEASSIDEDDDAIETTTSATGRSAKSEKASSTTEESRNGSLTDLADSFGGNEGLDTVSEEPLPPPRKNGFYFFSDWNSFLEVGEEPDKVVVRFDPKVGDPSPFIPVKIP